MTVGIDVRLGVSLFFGAQTSYSIYQLVAGEIPTTVSRVHLGVSRIFDVLSTVFYGLQWSHQAGLIHLKHAVFPIFTLGYTFIAFSSALHVKELSCVLAQIKAQDTTARKQCQLDLLMHCMSILFGVCGLGELFLGVSPGLVTVMGVTWIVAFVAAKSYALHRWVHG